MGSPETCPTCGSPDRLVRFCRDTKYVWKRSCGVPCPNDDFHATPTPPAPDAGRCPKCGEPADPWADGDGGDERRRCKPAPDAAAVVLPLSRGDVARYVASVLAHDATLSAPPDSMIDEVWSLCDEARTLGTILPLAVRTWDRGQSFARMKADNDRLRSLLHDAEDAAPLPTAPAHDAVRSATERVVNAWRRMDAHGSDAELRRAVDALYEAWTDAAERAQGEKGGDRG